VESNAELRGIRTSLTLDIYGNLKTATDALNRVSSNSYDDLDRLTQTVSDVGGIAATVSFGYDAAGNLIRVTDPKALHTDYTYDTANVSVRRRHLARRASG
jgi:YD repeat-containing protein